MHVVISDCPPPFFFLQQAPPNKRTLNTLRWQSKFPFCVQLVMRRGTSLQVGGGVASVQLSDCDSGAKTFRKKNGALSWNACGREREQQLPCFLLKQSILHSKRSHLFFFRTSKRCLEQKWEVPSRGRNHVPGERCLQSQGKRTCCWTSLCCRSCFFVFCFELLGGFYAILGCALLCCFIVALYLT